MKLISSLVALAMLASFAAAQGEDPCTATPIPAVNGLYCGDTTTALPSGYAVPCDGYTGSVGSKDHWFVVNLPCPSTLAISTCPGSNGGTGSGYDTNISINSGTPSCPWSTGPGGLTIVACSDDAPPCYSTGYQSAIGPTAVPAGTYYLRVGGWSSSDAGPYCLEVQIAPAGSCFLLDIADDGISTVTVTHTGGNPLDGFYMAFSFDPINVTNFGTGWWYGLHIGVLELFANYNAGLIVSALDANGGNVVAFGGLPLPLGITATGVTVCWNGLGVYTQKSNLEQEAF